MSVSTCTEADCAALRNLTDAGMEVVVVQDKDFESALKLIEQVRWSTPSKRKVSDELSKMRRRT